MSKMSKIEFLGWSNNLPETLVAYFFNKRASNEVLNLADLLLILPTKSAVRRVQELLLLEAEERGIYCNLPNIITVGGLSDYLIDDTLLFGEYGSLTQTSPCQEKLLVAKILADLSSTKKAALKLDWCGSDVSILYAEATEILRLYSELASTGDNFYALKEKICNYVSESQVRRWEIIFEVLEIYKQQLLRLNLVDRELKRELALAKKYLHKNRKIFICGCVELSSLLVKFLQDSEADLQVAVFAPIAKADFFDQYGRLVSEKWQQSTVGLLMPGQVSFFKDHESELLDIKNQIKNENDVAQKLCVGLANSTLEEYCSSEELNFRVAAGKRLKSSNLYQLLSEIFNHLQTASFASFEVLLKNYFINAWLSAQADLQDYTLSNNLDLVSAVNRFHYECLPMKIGNADKLETKDLLISLAHKKITVALSSFAHNIKTEDFIFNLRNFLCGIFSTAEAQTAIARDSFLRSAFEELNKLCSQLEKIELVYTGLSSLEIFKILLAEFGNIVVEEELDFEKIEVLGWLELLFDDRPALHLIGMNEQLIPETSSNDQFLPDSLRAYLGLTDNKRRFARENYILQVLNESRVLSISCAQYSSDGKALLPSRLVIPQAETELATFLRQFLTISTAEESSALESQATNILELSEPKKIETPIMTTSLSGLNTYLKCPYVFYLQHILKIENRYTYTDELNAAQFGSIIHEILKNFGQNEIAQSSNATEIRKYLHAELERYLSIKFPCQLFPAVLLQIETMKKRLAKFADLQAQRVEEGWQIMAVEKDFAAGGLKIAIGNDFFNITGRIDRIDYQQSTNSWAIIDYKTGKSAAEVEKAHFNAGRWVSLQLPVYYQAFKTLYPDASRVELCYCVLSEDHANSAFMTADWDQDFLDLAKQKIVEVCESIAGQKFWPPVEPKSQYEDPYSFRNGRLTLC